jgi:hypothetical protein
MTVGKTVKIPRVPSARALVRKLIRKPRSSWTHFVTCCRLEDPDELRGVSYSQACSLLSPRWKMITPEEKAPYLQFYQKDRQRYETDLQNLSIVDRELILSSSKSKRKNKKRNGLKLPMSTYMCFMRFERPKVVHQYPEMTFADIAREIGRRWKVIPEDDFKICRDLAVLDTQRYRSELETVPP